MYKNCFIVKLFVLNPLLNAVRYDMVSPDCQGDGPLLFFALEVLSKNKSVCYFAGSRPQIERETLLLDLLLINQINVMSRWLIRLLSSVIPVHNWDDQSFFPETVTLGLFFFSGIKS